MLDQLQRVLPSEHGPLDILDVGCGDGLLLPVLDRLGQARGIEIDTNLLTDHPYRDRIYTQSLGHEMYRNMQFDVITALDVIEHIEDDKQALADMTAMLKPGGLLLITVPAFNLLWDEHDKINFHYRRYRRHTVQKLLQPMGDICDLRYLFVSLFPLKLAVKIINLLRKQKQAQHHLPGRFTNMLMGALCAIEYGLLGWASLPLGTSVLAVLRKPLVATQQGIHSNQDAGIDTRGLAA